MKKIILAASSVLALSATTFAMAGGLEADKNLQQQPKGGFYVGAGAGWGSIDASKDDVLYNVESNSPQKIENTGFAARLNVGYLFPMSGNFLLGVEGGYTYLPKVVATFGKFQGFYKQKDSILDLLGVAKFYFNDRFNVFGKAGVALVNQSNSKDYSDSQQDKLTSLPFKKVHEILPELAVGMGYNITNNLEATVTYSHVFGHGNNLALTDLDKKTIASYKPAIPSINTVMVGMNYYFN